MEKEMCGGLLKKKKKLFKSPFIQSQESHCFRVAEGGAPPKGCRARAVNPCPGEEAGTDHAGTRERGGQRTGGTASGGGEPGKTPKLGPGKRQAHLPPETSSVRAPAGRPEWNTGHDSAWQLKRVTHVLGATFPV